jgi:hypothetical protein
MLCRLLYASRISAEAASDLTRTMEDILVVSSRLNLGDGITGLLLADGETFVQALEGPDALVVACYERILKDPRHTPRLKHLTGIEERRFPRWSMCGLSLSAADDAILTLPDIGFDLTQADAGALLQHLEGIAYRHGLRLDVLHERLLSAS